MKSNFSGTKIVYFGPKIQYLERELGWRHIEYFEFENEYENYSRVYLIGENIREVISLFLLQDRAYVYLYADETYKVFRTLLLCLNPKIINIMRSYPIHNLKIPNFRSLSKFVFLFRIDKSKTSQNVRILSKIFISLAAGVVMSLRRVSLNLLEQIRFTNRIQERWIPLGYTNKFAQTFIANLEPTLESEESLINFFLEIKIVLLKIKIKRVVFRGQIGKFQRQDFFREFESLSLPISISTVFNQVFSGGNEPGKPQQENSSEYVCELLESTFALCPPGNYSNETFRFWESLLCGCAPVVAEFVISDPLSSPRGITLSEFRELVRCSDDYRLRNETTSLVVEQVHNWKEQCKSINNYLKMS